MDFFYDFFWGTRDLGLGTRFFSPMFDKNNPNPRTKDENRWTVVKIPFPIPHSPFPIESEPETYIEIPVAFFMIW